MIMGTVTYANILFEYASIFLTSDAIDTYA